MKLLPFIAAAILATACSTYDPYPTEPTSHSPTHVDVAFCSFAAPKWVAIQKPDGVWAPVTPHTSGSLTTFRLTIYEDRAAIAVARDFSSGLTSLAVEYGLPAELAAAGDGTAAGCAQSFDRTVAGNVAGLDSNEAASISVDGHAFDSVSPLHGTDFKLESVAAGQQDILAARFSHVANSTKLTGIILRHGVDLTDDGAVPDIDFKSAEVFQPVTRQLILGGLTGSASQVYGIRTARGGDRFLNQTAVVGDSIQSITTAPEAALAPADLQFVVATAAPIAGTNIVRGAKTYFRKPADRSLAFGPVSAGPELTIVATAPALRLSARFTAQPEYDRAAVISFQQGQAIVSLAMTDAYARLAGGYNIVLPDFSTAAGFESRWGLDANQSVLWTSSRIGGTLGLGVNAVPVDGTVVRIATDAGNVIRP